MPAANSTATNDVVSRNAISSGPAMPGAGGQGVRRGRPVAVSVAVAMAVFATHQVLPFRAGTAEADGRGSLSQK